MFIEKKTYPPCFNSYCLRYYFHDFSAWTAASVLCQKHHLQKQLPLFPQSFETRDVLEILPGGGTTWQTCAKSLGTRQEGSSRPEESGPYTDGSALKGPCRPRHH